MPWQRDKIPYGGDYNPEQWPEETWAEDMRLFRLAGVDCVTLNVFSWALLQPDEHSYDFALLDRIMDMAERNALSVILATSTGAHPAWMAKRYPEVLRVEPNGMRRKFGGRHNSCPNSPVFRKYAAQLAGELARRYGGRPNLVAWHVGNEYGGECHCDNCESAFRDWLKHKYGALDELNRAWNTRFWGHTFYDWDEIVLPDLRSEHFDGERTMFQGITLDYKRFNSDSMLENYLAEQRAIRAACPGVPVTTNLMWFYKGLDYQKWGRHMDFVSWDSYPEPNAEPARIAMAHDLMRGVGGGAPFWLMEQTPSATNWQSYNALKRPGVMRLYSYQAVAHGADAVLFFQMRRSIGACEKMHGAVIDHVGTEHTRVFREVSELGAELKTLGAQTLGGRTPASVALVMDWDNWWAMEACAGPTRDLNYLEQLSPWYDALHRANVPVDIVSVAEELDPYWLVIAPALYMVKPGYAETLERYVERGGHLVSSFFSGLVDEHDLVVTGGYPGQLRRLLGIWVEEIDALCPGQENGFAFLGKRYPARLLCDILRPEGAEPLASFERDFYQGSPAVTVNQFGEGRAWYVGTQSGGGFYDDFLAHVLKQAHIDPIWAPVPGVEVALRQRGSERCYFFLNHADRDAELTMERAGTSLLDGRRLGAGERANLPAKGVLILKVSEDEPV